MPASYAIVAAPSGVLLEQSSFPTTPVGLRRARDWIGRRTEGDLDSVLVAAEGTGSSGALLGDVPEDAGYRVVEAPTPRRERGRANTDTLDAVLAARSTFVMPLTMLRDRRSGEAHTALRVLTVAREHLNGERVRCINGLTALVRSHALDIDARKALSSQQIDAIAGWRRRDEPFGVAVARAGAVRLAKRIRTLDDDLADNRTTITSVVAVEAPELLDLHGVGAITAASVLTVWSHPGGIRTEAAFAQIAGTAPIPASSGNTVRHRLNRGGDRQLNRALHTIVLTRIRTDQPTRTYVERRLAEGKTGKEIRRCLKRYVGHRIVRALTAAHSTPTVRLQQRDTTWKHPGHVRPPAVVVGAGTGSSWSNAGPATTLNQVAFTSWGRGECASRVGNEHVPERAQVAPAKRSHLSAASHSAGHKKRREVFTSRPFAASPLVRGTFCARERS